MHISIINWIEAEFTPESCTSDMFIYDDMASQSGYSLPIIYQPFDGTKKSHWNDRGHVYDFLYTTNSRGKNVLDFGPGDGWPSLIMAPFVKQVIGLDSSLTRVAVCTENARRLGIRNTVFKCYSSGDNLPFQDRVFDGITAASSIEQAPDPQRVLRELYRVLKPGGRLRIKYESLSRYKNGLEKDIWVAELKHGKSRIILFNRNIEEEYVIHYGITLTLSKRELMAMFAKSGMDISYNNITIEILTRLKEHIIDVKKSRTTHPSGKTYVKWLKEVGFSRAVSTYDGGYAAAELYDYYQDNQKVSTVECVDQLIKPTVKVVCNLSAPIELNMPITAIK